MAAARAPSMRITVLHAHLGSGILDVGALARRCMRSWSASPTASAPSTAIDIGGGLGVPYEPDDDPFDVAAFGRAMAEIKAA